MIRGMVDGWKISREYVIEDEEAHSGIHVLRPLTRYVREWCGLCSATGKE
jgi:hypothetical protein